MHSIRTKTTQLTVCAIVIAMAVSTLLGVRAIKSIGNSSSERMLLLLCETGEKNLDSYFESVEQSVETVSTLAKSNLESPDFESLEAHVAYVYELFAQAANRTHGVLTYYYRIDPTVSETVKGFWYVNTDDKGFQEHEVTDITQYDTQDTSALVWFTVPKATGEGIWLPPYITDNLDVRVISYNVPIYQNDRFIGVIGIEIDYSTMAQQVDHIKLYNNGYAFLNDEEGNIVYHPRIDVTALTEETKPKVPDGLLSTSSLVRYEYEGTKKLGVWLPLSNGMRLNVTVPVSEINGNWQHLILEIIFFSVLLLAAFILVTLHFTGKITKPLRKLTEAAAQMDTGNYDLQLDYDKNDEVGLLTRTFNQLTSHLKIYISELNSLAYADALTSVHNKGAYDICAKELQMQVESSNESPKFAIGVFDCNDLKAVNDRYGHEKGDIYLKTASALICNVFQHSPVFRVGGDEFVVVLQNGDFEKRDALVRLFEETSTEICALNLDKWEQVHVAVGLAVYDPKIDHSVDDVMRRADKLMYEDKRSRKAAGARPI